MVLSQTYNEAGMGALNEITCPGHFNASSMLRQPNCLRRCMPPDMKKLPLFSDVLASAPQTWTTWHSFSCICVLMNLCCGLCNTAWLALCDQKLCPSNLLVSSYTMLQSCDLKHQHSWQKLPNAFLSLGHIFMLHFNLWSCFASTEELQANLRAHNSPGKLWLQSQNKI